MSENFTSAAIADNTRLPHDDGRQLLGDADELSETDADVAMRGLLLRDQLGLVTERELAAAIGVRPYTLQSYRLAGKAPDHVELGRAIFYRVADVEDWVKSRVKVARRAK